MCICKKNKNDTLHLWYSKILTMVYDFTSHPTISPDVDCCIITSLDLLKKYNIGWILKTRKNDIMHLKCGVWASYSNAFG